MHSSAGSLHVWHVCGFELYLIFSHTTNDTLFVQRVFHGSRDIEPRLDDADLSPSPPYLSYKTTSQRNVVTHTHTV